MARCATWQWFGLLLLTAGWLGGPAALRAEEKVRVTVVAILATDQNTKVDRRLKCIADEVRKVEPKLTGFQIGQITCTPVAVGNSYKVPLVEKAVAEVVIQQGADKDKRVKLKVKAPKMGDLVYTSICGKFFPIVTRYQTKDKERLIIAIMVRPCKH